MNDAAYDVQSVTRLNKRGNVYRTGVDLCADLERLSKSGVEVEITTVDERLGETAKRMWRISVHTHFARELAVGENLAETFYTLIDKVYLIHSTERKRIEAQGDAVDNLAFGDQSALPAWFNKDDGTHSETEKDH